MFIKKLIIATPQYLIREINFKQGLNLIVDDTPSQDKKQTGNNVGKTTVLKLIDFCLGAKPKIIYSDTEHERQEYNLVKDFLIEQKIEITLILTSDFNDNFAKEVIIKRNFLSRKETIRQINGKDILDKDFERELERLILPEKIIEKPTFRQVISHNIRYKDDSINKTLKTLNRYTTDIEYETLYLYLLGCSFDDGERKQSLVAKKAQENAFKKRLERTQTKSAYEIALSLIEDEIKELNVKKSLFNLNEDFEKDLEELNVIKYNINKISSLISKLNIKKTLIEESEKELNHSISSIDLEQLKVLYNEAKLNISGIQKSFEDLVHYHNNMIIEKSKFITQELPNINMNLQEAQQEMSELLLQEMQLSEKVSKGDSFEELEKVIAELNEKFRLKGEYENTISQLNEVENSINDLDEQIEDIDNQLFSEYFESLLKKQVAKFNKIFSTISQELYGEKYALKYDKVINKNGHPLYQFNAFNANMSSGKKQGEILCFDLAYTFFADQESIPTLHFLLNDKKELMHDNQLIRVSDYIQTKNIQLIISILKDKVPSQVIKNAHIAVELSQNSKLFRIE